MDEFDKARLAMTVNERLFDYGLSEAFNIAARAKNRDQMIQILMQARLSESQAAKTTSAILSHPVRYGY